jgi:hypothetical protein
MFPVDFHDDLGELLLRNPDSVEMELLKTASWKERDALYDRDFALILIDEQGREHRKFACYDAGTTAASVIYLLHGYEQLSPIAVKVASTNLSQAAQHFGLIIPEEVDILTLLSEVDTEARRRVLETESSIKVAQLTKESARGIEALKALVNTLPKGSNAYAHAAAELEKKLLGASLGRQAATSARLEAVRAAKAGLPESAVREEALKVYRNANKGTQGNWLEAEQNLANKKVGRKVRLSEEARQELRNLGSSERVQRLKGRIQSGGGTSEVIPSEARKVIQERIARGEAGFSNRARRFSRSQRIQMARPSVIENARAANNATVARLATPTTSVAPVAQTSSASLPSLASVQQAQAQAQALRADQLRFTRQTSRPVSAATPAAPAAGSATPRAVTTPAPSPSVTVDPIPTGGGRVPPSTPPPPATIAAPKPPSPEVNVFEPPISTRQTVVRPQNPQLPAQQPKLRVLEGDYVDPNPIPKLKPAEITIDNPTGVGTPKLPDAPKPAVATLNPPSPGAKPRSGSGWFNRALAAGGLAVGAGGTGLAAGTLLGQGMEQSKMASYDLLTKLQTEWSDLSFEEKRAAAVEVTKLAEAEGASVPPHIWQYAGTQLNPKFASAVIPQRKNYTANEELSELYDRLGAMAAYLGPEKTAEALFLLDQQASLTPRYGKNLPDPMLAVWGQEKTAAAKWVYGGDYVNEDQLTRYAAAMTSYHALEQIFSESFRDKFRANPIATFNAAPLEQKILLARMASQSRESNDGGT